MEDMIVRIIIAVIGAFAGSAVTITIGKIYLRGNFSFISIKNNENDCSKCMQGGSKRCRTSDAPLITDLNGNYINPRNEVCGLNRMIIDRKQRKVYL